jgi:mercury(II) reductase
LFWQVIPWVDGQGPEVEMNSAAGSAPENELNRRWLANVQPSDWKNPQPARRYNLVVVGAGTAGLVAAIGAAGVGAKVALVEAHRLGGDCLNTGCVPSKGMIKAARLVREFQQAREFGVEAGKGPQVDFARVMERVRRIRSEISWRDSATRARSLGVDVFLGTGRFRDGHTLDVDGHALSFVKAVIATGSRPAAPEVPGLDKAGFWTNETVFEISRLPERLAVVGGGPIGCELAQAFQRLGSRVLLLQHAPRLLEREDPEAAALVQKIFQDEGLEVVLSAELLGVEQLGEKKSIRYVSAGKETAAEVDEILVGAGRAPNVEHLDLEKAGVAYNRRSGVEVNEFLQTSNPRVFAAGDVCTLLRFTHAAEAMARLVVRNALFPGSERLDLSCLPRCTYTDPEVAHVGLSESELQAKNLPWETFKHPLAEVDRAAIDGETVGFVKLHAHRGTHRLLGATLVGAHAGEMLAEVTLAIKHRLKLGDLASVIHPYPTQGEALRQAAQLHERTRLTPTLKRWFSRWLAWQRGGR